LAGRELSFDTDVYTSELKTAFRNRSLGYMLRTVGVLEEDPEAIVNGYIKQCSIKVTVKDLAMIAGVLANGGIQPQTGKKLLDRSVVRQVLSVMLTCGMYDAAGDWLTTVGIPAKSGVAGGIIGVLPGQVGIAVFSPRIDEHGHSVRGVDIFERMSREMGLHLMGRHRHKPFCKVVISPVNVIMWWCMNYVAYCSLLNRKCCCVFWKMNRKAKNELCWI